MSGAIDNQLLTIESEIQNANKIKELVVNALVKKGYLIVDDALDFIERNNVILYKGSWFKRFFDKFVKKDIESGNINNYYFTVVEMREKKPMTLEEIN